MMTALRLRHSAASAGIVLLAALPRSAPVTGAVAPDPPAARLNDNRSAAGHLSAGRLTLALDLTGTVWQSGEQNARRIAIFAFAESGRAPSIPGPLIRVPAGTEIRATLHNRLDRPAFVHGLHDHDGSADSVLLAAGETRLVSFRANTPGTHFYWARTTTGGRLIGRHEDSQLIGAFIVDPRGSRLERHERIMMITAFDDTVIAPGFAGDHFQVFAINGRSWPGTERLQFTQGDTLHWRVINASDHFHPMHLHGFFFSVESHGSALLDTLYAAGDRRDAVTESLRPASSMAITWIADRPGNWLFHCHLIAHVDPRLRANRAAMAMHPGMAHSHMTDGMAGLVMAISIRERGARTAADPAPARRLRLFITEHDDTTGAPTAMSYVLQTGASAPAPDSVSRPGTTLVVRQHEPTEIVVTNLMRQATAVHWHGLELQSYYDGIGGWSGGPGRLAPMIAPGDSFTVRITPPRAGTYIYHSHAEEMLQLKRGLFGALIVLPAGLAERDTTERLLILTDAGPESAGDASLGYDLRRGVAHRLRIVSIPTVSIHQVRLLKDSTLERWRPLAKDGADLPSSRTIEQPADLLFGAGETMDVEILRPEAERLILEVTRVAPNPTVFRIPVTVH